MVEEESSGEKVKESTEQSQSDKAFDALSKIEPGRELDLLDDGEEGGGHKTFSERMEESPNLSDMQTADKRLFPRMGEGREHLEMLQVSRVFVDSYNPYGSVLVKDLLMKEEDLSVAEAIVLVSVAESIAIDGEGRIDVLGIAGAAKEESLLKEDKKGLGGLG